jgi:hypothetical protein
MKLFALTIIIHRPAARSRIRLMETTHIMSGTFLGLTHQPRTLLAPSLMGLMALEARCTTNHPTLTPNIFNKKTATQTLRCNTLEYHPLAGRTTTVCTLQQNRLEPRTLTLDLISSMLDPILIMHCQFSGQHLVITKITTG